MVKAYLRYEEARPAGVIAAGQERCLVPGAAGGELLASGLEQVQRWGVRTGELLGALVAFSDEPLPHVTCLEAPAAADPAPKVPAGYSDGSVRLWEAGGRGRDALVVTFRGHRSAVSALRLNGGGDVLASGGKDTEIVLWDVVGQAGLFRLKGHTGQVTDLAFVDRHHALVSSSKDGILRMWDLDTQACVQIVTAHQMELWSLDVSRAEDRLVVGATDAFLRFFEIGDEPAGAAAAAPEAGGVLREMGQVRRASTAGRVLSVRYNRAGTALGVLGAGKQLEVWRPRSEAEAAKKAKRRKKRKREKANSKANGAAKAPAEAGAAGGAAADPAAAGDDAAVATDEVELVDTLHCRSKIKSFCFYRQKGADVCVAVALQNNSIEIHEAAAGGNSRKLNTLDRLGHRHDIRALAVSSADDVVVSCSQEEIKVWNSRNAACLRTIESGYCLSAAFLPGDRHLVAGTKAGHLELFNVEAAQQLEAVEAHAGPTWGVALAPDGGTVASAGADGLVKFWGLRLAEGGGEGGEGRALKLVHVNTLEMPEDVLALQYSPDGKFIAVGMLDSSVKVFYADTLKFALSLYGHKLPVLCLDISSDSAFLASGSADKNIKVWGLDFGDCHKSLFAHADSVTQVKFVPNTHYLFSAGKDGKVKYWDMDKHELLLTLHGHHAEVWSLAVSSMGDFIYSGSHDKSLRRWERTEEPFFLEEEREKRLESLFDEGVEKLQGQAAGAEGAAAAAAGTSQEALTGADRIIEALELAAAEGERRAEAERQPERGAFAPNPLLLGLSPTAYVLRAVKGVRSSDLEQTLIMLPFTDALRVLALCLEWIRAPKDVELVVRVVMLLVRLHQPRLGAMASARQLLTDLRQALRPALEAKRDLLGYNLAALAHLRRAEDQAK